jgi:hypothetical protein
MGSMRGAWGEDDEAMEPAPPIFTQENVVWMVMICLIGLAIIGTFVIHDLSVQLNKLQSTAITCQEDMPCWDCTTMGNKICGPGK